MQDDIKDQVCDTLAYFVKQPNEDIQLFTLKAIGSLCIRHYDFMLGNELKTLYHRLLTQDDAPLHMRTQVTVCSHSTITQKVGKEKENSYQKMKRSPEERHTHRNLFDMF